MSNTPREKTGFCPHKYAEYCHVLVKKSTKLTIECPLEIDSAAQIAPECSMMRIRIGPLNLVLSVQSQRRDSWERLCKTILGKILRLNFLGVGEEIQDMQGLLSAAKRTVLYIP